MKWALIAVLTLAALGAWAMGLQAGGGLAGDVRPMQVPRAVMRPLPPLGGAIVVASKGGAKVPDSKEELPALPTKPEPVAAKPEPAPKPEPVARPEPKPEPVARPEPKPEPVKVAAAKEPAQPRAAQQPKPPSEEAAPKPAPKPPPEEKETNTAAPSAPSGSGEGLINLKASDTAEIVIDGRKVGPSPKLGYKLKTGKHKIRFDCYDENGNLKPGKVQTVDIKPDDEANIEYECPFSQ
jgi:hypothetical protein